jgi:hypothetical protein
MNAILINFHAWFSMASSGQNINIVLEGSSFSAYMLYNPEAQIMYPSSKDMIVQNSNQNNKNVVLHYPGWPSMREEVHTQVKPHAIIVFYESSAQDCPSPLKEFNNGSALLYSIGYNDEENTDFYRKRIVANGLQLLDFTININENSLNSAIKTISDDIIGRLDSI